MIAYKFLRSGRVGPFSGFQWPEPGVRVDTAPEVAVCRRGIHACRPSDLPWWLADELWEIELDGPMQVEEHKIIAAAGRLRSRIEAWTPACAQEYADACAWRAQGRAVAALAHAGHRRAARQLAACATLDEALVLARQFSARNGFSAVIWSSNSAAVEPSSEVSCHTIEAALAAELGRSQGASE